MGLSIIRGYNKQVQELLGHERGCTHLEFLARALGPVVIQGAASAGIQERPLAEVATGAQQQSWMRNTCHIWADDGPGAVKLELGWKPGTVYPVPRARPTASRPRSVPGRPRPRAEPPAAKAGPASRTEPQTRPGRPLGAMLTSRRPQRLAPPAIAQHDRGEPQATQGSAEKF